MPLLRKETFRRKAEPADLKPTDEVFFCSVTNEMFSDYNEFFERVILCNSLVWTCELTGKSNLTFQEALDSEERARKRMTALPIPLQKALIFLASLTHRSKINDMAEDVYKYVSDRFFIGEIVDVQSDQEPRKQKGVVEHIIIPDDETMNGVDNSDSDDEPLSLMVKSANMPSAFMYKLKAMGSEEVIPASAQSLTRSKLTRDKVRVFVKSYSHEVNGIFKIKESIRKKFDLDNTAWTDIFAGPPPTFPKSTVKKRPVKRQADDEPLAKLAKKDKQAKSASARGSPSARVGVDSPAPVPKISAEEKAAMKQKLREEAEQLRLRLKEEREKEKEQLKKLWEEEKIKRKQDRDRERDIRREKKKQYEEQMKEWGRHRDDLQCDDLEPMPEFEAVQSTIPNELFGEAVQVLEFLKSFSEAFEGFEENIPHTIGWGEFERGLAENSPDSLLADILRLLLTTINSLQREEEEDEDDQEDDDDDDDDKDEKPVEKASGPSGGRYRELIQSATTALQLPQREHGTALRDLQLDSLTLSEVLRLHLLSSGAKGRDENALFRYQQRGGYTDADDAGLDCKTCCPHILTSLTTTNVFDMPLGDKLQVLNILINQILTYATSRDFIEDKLEEYRSTKNELKQLQINEWKRVREQASIRWRKKVEENARKKEEEKAKKENVAPNTGESASETQNGKSSSPDVVKPSVVNEVPMGKKPTRRQIATEHSWLLGETVDETQLTAEQLQLRRQKQAELEAEHKATFERQEAQMISKMLELQRLSGVQPLGTDRVYRKYWLFNSLPGLFIENLPEVPDEMLEPVEQTGGLKKPDTKPDVESTSTPTTSRVKINDTDSTTPATSQENSSSPTLDVKPAQNGNTESEVNGNAETMEVDEQSAERTCDVAVRQIKQLAADRIRWSFCSNPEKVVDLINCLNVRGHRESNLKNALNENKQQIIDMVVKVPIKQLIGVSNDESGSKAKVRSMQQVKSRRRALIQGMVVGDTARESLELNLREMLLDLEERVYHGSLGVIKVSDRDAWRKLIETGNYRPLTDQLDWSGRSDDIALLPRYVNDITDAGDDVDDNEAPALIVQDLSRALLQIAQGIEQRFLHKPLGLSEDVKRERMLQMRAKRGRGTDVEEKKEEDESMTQYGRWEQALMQSTSLSQIFLFLSTLERSVEWNKSILNARCRMCRKKTDPDLMLLCDGCDHGHHTYCCKPKLKVIPKGEWYCHDCKPLFAAVTKTPRKQRRKTYNSESESEEAEQSEESEEEQQIESEEEEKTPPPRKRAAKIKLKGGRLAHVKKSEPSSGRSTPNSVTSGRGRKLARSAQNSPAPDVDETVSSSSRGGERARLMKEVEQLIEEIARHDDAWPFLLPVKKSEVPDYHKIIKVPMDLSTMKNKIRRVDYIDPDAMMKDFRRIFLNCRVYNRPSAKEFQAGKRLETFLDKRIKQKKLKKIDPGHLDPSDNVDEKPMSRSRSAARLPH